MNKGLQAETKMFQLQTNLQKEEEEGEEEEEEEEEVMVAMCCSAEIYSSIQVNRTDDEYFITETQGHYVCIKCKNEGIIGSEQAYECDWNNEEKADSNLNPYE